MGECLHAANFFITNTKSMLTDLMHKRVEMMSLNTLCCSSEKAGNLQNIRTDFVINKVLNAKVAV